MSTPLRIADHYIEKRLMPEEAEYSEKFSKKMGQMIQYQNMDKRSPQAKIMSESVDVSTSKSRN